MIFLPSCRGRRRERIRAAVVAAADLDGALRLDGDGGDVRQPHRHLDRHGPEAHAHRHKHLHR